MIGSFLRKAQISGRVLPTGDLLLNDPEVLVSDYLGTLTQTSNNISLLRPLGAGAGLNGSAPTMRVTFVTSSTQLDFKMSWPSGMGQSNYDNGKPGAVLVNNKHESTFSGPTHSSLPKVEQYSLALGTGRKTVSIVWPTTAYATMTEIKLDAGCTVSAPFRTTEQMIYYGDSITQGWLATRGDLSYAFISADTLGVQSLNVGVVGATASATDVTTVVSGQSAANFLMAMGTNEFGNQVALSTFKTTVANCITNARSGLPNARLFIQSPVYRQGTNTIPLSDYRAKIKEAVEEAIVAGDRKVFYIDGLTLMDNNPSRVPDSVHPDDLGHAEIGSNVATFVSRSAPSAPASLTASSASATSISLSWSNVANETAYLLERKTGSNAFAEIALVLADVTSYTDTGLTTGQQYTYRIRAYNQGGNGPYSAESSATPVVPPTVSVSYLIVGGGGGGGSSQSGYPGGGGGAGAYRTGTASLNVGTLYNITIGAGGAVDTAGTSSSGVGVTSVGGGEGGNGGTTVAAGNGGSGGGGGCDSATGTFGVGGTGTAGQGNAGGDSFTFTTTADLQAGGGGGASGTGANGTATNAGNGGAGTASSITGSSLTYAIGGGGGSFASGKGIGAGDTSDGSGYGGNLIDAIDATAGRANRGNGGGGGRGAKAGGSGVVVLSVATSDYSGTYTNATVTTSGGNTILTFSSSGSYTA